MLTPLYDDLRARTSFAEQATQALDIIAELYAVERAAKETGHLRNSHCGERGCAHKSRRQSWRGCNRGQSTKACCHKEASAKPSLRGIVVGRKNHYGSKSQRGTEVAALFYSLIESCKLNGVDPGKYLAASIGAAVRGQLSPLPHDAKIDALLAEPQIDAPT